MLQSGAYCTIGYLVMLCSAVNMHIISCEVCRTFNLEMAKALLLSCLMFYLVTVTKNIVSTVQLRDGQKVLQFSQLNMRQV